MNSNNEENCEWISVSELAKRIGKTNQTAYNQVKAGRWKSRTFTRGSMIGILVAYPKERTNEQ